MAAPSPEVTSTNVAGVSFAFFGDEEVRRLSVCRLTSPIARDNLGAPVPGGLYDPAMGPLEMHERCVTCGLPGAACAGHFGHIELAVPVYNPLVFGTLYKLLKSTCLHCFKFRMKAAEADSYARRLALLREGRVVEAASLVAPPRERKADREKKGGSGEYGGMSLGSDDSSTSGSESGGEEDGAAGEIKGSKVKSRRSHSPAPKTPPLSPPLSPSRSAPPTSLCIEAAGELEVELFKRQPASVCGNCGCHNPALRRDGVSKLFVARLPPHREAQNAAAGVPVVPAVPAPGKEGGEGEEAEEAAAAHEAVALEQALTAATASAANAAASPSTMLLSDRQNLTGAAAAGLRLMTPAEAGEVARRLWIANETVLRELYAKNAPGGVFAAAASPFGSGRKQRASSSSSALSWRDAYRAFFISTVAVPPNRLRPPSRLGDATFEHPHNIALAAVVSSSVDVASAAAPKRGIDGDGGAPLASAPTSAPELAAGLRSWLSLQSALNSLIDSSAPDARSANAGAAGVRQALEKKEGLFRKHMMGKRVNYAARSVISPDPRLLPREVGIPPYFAVRLSVPERATEANAKELRRAVRNGARQHPGALAVEDEQGRVVSLIGLPAAKRDALARSLLARKTSAVVVGGGGGGGGKGTAAAAAAAPDGKVSAAAAAAAAASPSTSSTSFDPSSRSKIVYRHLVDGDVVLTNRQPTLHRPGLVAHRARILNGERTIRLHYANCAAFNADFDGDEINLHAPQDLLGRAEARELVAAERQFVVPTDGKPVRGLIQDAVVAGTRLCCRGELLRREEATQLLWNAVAPRQAGDDEARMPFVRLPPPAILKALPPGSLSPPPAPPPPAAKRGGSGGARSPPSSSSSLRDSAPIWTGKQIIDGILACIAAGRPPLTVFYATKVPADAWPGGLAFGAEENAAAAAAEGGGGNTRRKERPPFRLNPRAEVDLGEGSALVLSGKFLTGTLDKAAYGRGGIVHAVHEVYGAIAADDLLAALSRVGGAFLERRGFTCGVGDLLLADSVERERDELLAAADERARQAAVDFAVSRGHAEVEVEESEKGAGSGSDSDSLLRSALAALARASGGDAAAALDACVTAPLHGLSSDVIRACLPKGLVLPFPANCLSMMTTTGAKGSGVNFSQISCLLGQQELEGRRVPRSAAGRTLPCFAPFDASARAGGYVADRFLSGLRPQEYYFHCMAGREGLVDTTVKTARSGYLQRCLVKCLEPLSGGYDGTVRDGADSSIVQFAYGDGDGRDVAGASLLTDFRLTAANAPAMALGLRAREAKASTAAAAAAEPETTSPAFEAALAAFLTETVAPSGVRDNAVGGAGAVAAEAATRALNEEGEDEEEGTTVLNKSKKKTEKKKKPKPSALTFADLARVKFAQAALAPGEAVGVLAAQSIGEPSTQMTLNTFHMAGRGDANVTMGVPRLRELFMTASPHAATPSMDLPLPPHSAASDPASASHYIDDDAAERLVRHLRRVRLAEALAGIQVREAPAVASGSPGFGSGARRRSRCYRVTLTLLPASAGVPSFETLETTFREKFVPALVGSMAAELRRAAASGAAAAAVVVASAAAAGDEGGEGGAARAASAAVEDGKDGSVDDCGAGGGSDRATPSKGKKAPKKQSKDGEDEDAEADADFVDAKTAARGGGAGSSSGPSKANRERDAGYGVPDEDEAVELAAARRPSISPSPAGSDDDENDDDDAGKTARSRRPTSSTPSAAAAASASASRAASKAAVAAAGVEAGEPLADEEGRTLSLELRVPPSAPRLFLLQLAERAAASPAADVSAVPGVERAALIVARNGSRLVRCEGVNLFGAFEAAISAVGAQHGGEANAADAAADAVAAATTTNDVGASLRALGVEAARTTLVAQASALFGAYGIGVDARHLGLIADFMTRRGGYSPCNRLGIDSSTSPLLRVSFETAASFLAAATLSGEADALRSPAARIALGRPVSVGTGCFGLRQKI